MTALTEGAQGVLTTLKDLTWTQNKDAGQVYYAAVLRSDEDISRFKHNIPEIVAHAGAVADEIQVCENGDGFGVRMKESTAKKLGLVEKARDNMPRPKVSAEDHVASGRASLPEGERFSSK